MTIHAYSNLHPIGAGADDVEARIDEEDDVYVTIGDTYARLTVNTGGDANVWEQLNAMQELGVAICDEVRRLRSERRGDTEAVAS